MIVIVAGSRKYRNYGTVVQAISLSGFEITRLVSGRAPGVDTLGERWAFFNRIPISPFPADWEHLGKRAGPIRNRQMAEFVVAHQEEYGGCGLVAVWYEPSHRGTDDMIAVAKQYCIPTYIHKVP